MSHFSGLILSLEESVGLTSIDKQVNLLELLNVGRRVMTKEEMTALINEDSSVNLMFMTDDTERESYKQKVDLSIKDLLTDYDIQKHTLWFCQLDTVTYAVRFDNKYESVMKFDDFAKIVEQYGWTYSLSNNSFVCTTNKDDMMFISGSCEDNFIKDVKTSTGLKVGCDHMKICEVVNAVSLV